jgi:hypothetical protein
MFISPFEAYLHARNGVFKPETIEKSFAVAGLVPHDPDATLFS